MPTVSPDDPVASGPAGTPGTSPRGDGPPLVRRTIVADALLDPDERRRLGFPAAEDEPLPVVVELNLRHHDGLSGARRRFLELYGRVPGERRDPEPELVAETYYRCRLSVEQVRALVAADMVDADPARTSIYRIWPDFPVNPLIDLSCSTAPADAASPGR
jgi:serine protease AprX